MKSINSLVTGKNEIINTHILSNLDKIKLLTKRIENIYWTGNMLLKDGENDSWESRNSKITNLVREIHGLSLQNIEESLLLGTNA